MAIFDHGVWKAWQPSAAYEQFPDLYQGLDPEDFAQVRPLLFGKKEQDSNVNRKARQDDANKLAKAFAKESRNEEIMDLRRRIDEDTRDVLSVAATRMNILLKDKSHFTHQGKQEDAPHKVPLAQQKKSILQQLENRPDVGGHSWQPYRTGVRCGQCKQRFHGKSLIAELRGALDSTCDLAVVPSPARKTRFQVIDELIGAQTGVQQGVHHLKLDKAYLRCTECANYILARCNEDAFSHFVGSPCLVGPLEPSLWSGHPSHTMSCKGNTARCTRCGGTARIRDDKIELNTKLNRRCIHQGSQDPRNWFT